MMSAGRSFSVVVPAYNAAAHLGACLAALRACDPAPRDIIVVDDGSTDATAQTARACGATVCAGGSNRGAAAARNLGAQHARGDVLVFVDADIIVAPDLFARLDAFWQHHPAAAAVSGVYAPACPVDAFASVYKNLYLVDAYSGKSAQPAGTINTSLAAIDRATFASSGGFDPQWRASEDTVFGEQLAAQGRQLFIADDMRMVHLKRYTLMELLRDDARKSYWMARSAWRQVIAGQRGQPRSAWQRHRRAQAARIPVAFMIVAAAAATLANVPGAGAAAVLALAVFTGMSGRLLNRLRREQGLWFAARALPLHVAEMCVAGAAVAVALVDTWRWPATAASVRAGGSR